MPGCGNCQRAPIPVQPPASLCQIEEGYRTGWNGLQLSIRMDRSQWMLRVRDEARGTTIYTAYRGSANAAKLAAAEFAIFQVFGFSSPMNPSSLAQSLQWQLCW